MKMRFAVCCVMLLSLVSASAFAQGTIEVTVTRSIQVDADDAEEYLTTFWTGYPDSYDQGFGFINSSDLEISSEGENGLSWQVCAVQYDSLGIPQGSTITAAKITFQVDNAGNAGDNSDVTILAEAADNAAVFGFHENTTSYSGSYIINQFEITKRDRSTASVAWTVPYGPPTVGDKMDTPDLTTVIQEVVDRPGWSADNRLTLMFFPDVWLNSEDPTTALQEIEFEAGPGDDSAMLSVTYEAEVPAGPMVIVPSSPYAIDGESFSLTAPGGLPYQWSLDGTEISGATSQVLAFAALALDDAGTYLVTFDDGEAKATGSATYDLVVYPVGATVPVTGLLGLGLLAGACALGGASALRRKK